MALTDVLRLADAARDVLPGHYAIHDTYATGVLGRRASHGCIRLPPGQAATLFHLARSYGGAAVVIGN